MAFKKVRKEELRDYSKKLYEQIYNDCIENEWDDEYIIRHVIWDLQKYCCDDYGVY